MMRRDFLVLVIGVAAFLLFGGHNSASVLAAPPCDQRLSACPDHGCANAGTPDAFLNERKKTWPSSNPATEITLDDFEALQTQADRLFGHRKQLTAQDRGLLRHLKLTSFQGHVSEGDFVQVVGYLVGLPQRPKAEGPESVNCNLMDDGTHRNNDFHIPIARNPGDTEYEGVVVEMIPQKRPVAWKINGIRQMARDQLQVLVRGQLMYDNKHVVNKDPQNDNRQPKRFSLWEVHPVTEFYVCRRNSCASDDLTQWELVGKVQ